MSDTLLQDTKTVLTDPHRALPASHVPHSAGNRVLFNEIINGGSGTPERLQAQLPARLLDEELGLEVLQWIGKHVEAATDSATEVATEWLTAPPIVVEAKRYILVEVLAEWRGQVLKADQYGSALTSVQKRLSLRKLSGKLKDVEVEWKTLKAQARSNEVDVEDNLPMLDSLAEEYSAEKTEKAESHRLTVMFAGANLKEEGSGAEGEGRRNRRKLPNSKQPCWAFAKGKCTRGDASRFSHYEAGTWGVTDTAQCTGVATGGECGEPGCEGDRATVTDCARSLTD